MDVHDCAPDTRTWRRARVSHECCACPMPIRKGDWYHRTVQFTEGTVETWLHCARCWLQYRKLTAEGR